MSFSPISPVNLVRLCWDYSAWWRRRQGHGSTWVGQGAPRCPGRRCDVAGRASNRTYVQACHALGPQHPDLTAHGSQVAGWYESEAGLDLRVLDGDIAELRAAVFSASVTWADREPR